MGESKVMQYFGVCYFAAYISCDRSSSSRGRYPLIISIMVVGARGVMIIVIGNGHGDTSSNLGRDQLHFTSH